MDLQLFPVPLTMRFWFLAFFAGRKELQAKFVLLLISWTNSFSLGCPVFRGQSWRFFFPFETGFRRGSSAIY